LRRLLLVALPVTAAFGSFIPGLSSRFVFRLLAPALLIYGIPIYRRSEFKLGVTTRFRDLAVVWVLVGLTGLFFVQDHHSGVRELTFAMRLLHAGVDTTVIALWLGPEQSPQHRSTFMPT